MEVLFDEKGLPQNLVGKTPTVINKTLTLANTEYSQILPADTTRFTLQARTSHDVKLSYTSGESGTVYITIKAGSSYTEENLDTGSALTLRMQSTNAGIVVEIIAFSF